MTALPQQKILMCPSSLVNMNLLRRNIFDGCCDEKKNVFDNFVIDDDHDADNAANVDDGGELDDGVVWQPADTQEDAADEHHGAGKKAPKEKVELCSLRLIGNECILKSIS